MYCYLGNKYLGKLIKEDNTYRFIKNNFLSSSSKIEQFLKNFSTSDSIENFIKSRVKDFNNTEVLKLFSLEEFTEWEIFKRVKGMSIYDNFKIMLEEN